MTIQNLLHRIVVGSERKVCRINKPLGFILYENQKAVGPGGSYLDIGWSVYRARGWSVQVEETDRLYTWGDGEIEKFWKQRNTFEISLCADCCSVLLDLQRKWPLRMVVMVSPYIYATLITMYTLNTSRFFLILSIPQQSLKTYPPFCLINHKVIKRRTSTTVLGVLDGQNNS